MSNTKLLELSDDRIVDLVDKHVGGPTPSYPLDMSDWINFARAAIYADRALFADRERQAGEAVAYSEDWWYDLASRHANDDWGSNQPDGFMNSVKALVADALASIPAPQAVQAEWRYGVWLAHEHLKLNPEYRPGHNVHDTLASLLAAPSPDGKAEQAEAPGWEKAAVSRVFSTLRYLLGVKTGEGSPADQLQSIIDTIASWAAAGPRSTHAEAMKQAAAVRALATQPTASNAGERPWVRHNHLTATYDTPDGTRVAQEVVDNVESLADVLHVATIREDQRATLTSKPPAGEQKPVARLLTAQEVQRCTLGLGGQASASAVQRQFASVNGVRIEGQETAACAQCGGAGSITATDGTGPYNCFACMPQPEQVAQDGIDAERWRWIRDGNSDVQGVIKEPGRFSELLADDELDKIADARRAARARGEKGGA